MVQDNVFIDKLIENATNYLKKQNYSDSSIKKYLRYWWQLKEHWRSCYISISDYDECLYLMKQQWKIPDSTKITDNQRFRLRTVKCLFDLLTTGSFLKYHSIISEN